MSSSLAATAVLAVALTAGCTAHVAGTARPGAPQATASDSTVTSASVTSEYPDCVTDALAYLDYLKTGQPPTLDVQYGDDREHVLYLRGDALRIELAKLSTAHVQRCEKRHHDEEAAAQSAADSAAARQRAAADAAAKKRADDAVLRKEAATCARVHGQWGSGGSCYLTYVSPKWGSTGGYTVFFDENGNVTGDRNGCPDREWHADTRICTE